MPMMTPSTPIDEMRPIDGGAGASLRVSTYDRVAAVVTSFLVLLGATAAVLVVMCFLGRPKTTNEELTPEINLVSANPSGGDPGAMTLDEPQAGEFTDPIDVVTDFEPIEQFISTHLVHLDQLSGLAKTGRGKDRDTGPFPSDLIPDVEVPPWQRWRIVYSSVDLESYARQLDFFGIELGAVGGPAVDYLTQMSSPSPLVRSAPSADERRLYLTWKHGSLQDTDKQLLLRAGIAVDGRVVAQFLPPALEKSLPKLELDYSQGRVGARRIRQTVFGVRAAGNGFEFEVQEQYYRAL